MWTELKCDYCGTPFVPSRKGERFCKSQCRIAWHNQYQRSRPQPPKQTEGLNQCQYYDPDKGDICGKPTTLHFLCPEHFESCDENITYSINVGRRPRNVD